jgi:hypothetical protein
MPTHVADGVWERGLAAKHGSVRRMRDPFMSLGYSSSKRQHRVLGHGHPEDNEALVEPAGLAGRPV